MRKTRKMMVLALAASMVCSSFTAFAADNEGSTTGNGTVEGHVEQKVTNVILPTDTSGSSLFAYTMDPERLIQGTDAAKYEEGSVFPEAAGDTGVYFLTGDKTYANTSNAYQVINKSSCDVVVTVKVKAVPSTDASKDIGLVEETALASATDPKLYLGLNVGSETKAVTTTEATIAKTIAGTPTNFKIGVKTDSADSTKKVYEYQEKADASTWKAMNLSMTGKVTTGKAIANDTTAPAVQVTWSWAEKTDSDAAANAADMVDYVTGPQLTVSTTGLINMTGLNADLNYKSMTITEEDGKVNNITVAPVTYAADNWSEENGGILGIQLGEQWMDYLKGKTVTFTLTLSDNSTKTKEVTFPEA